MDGQNATPIRNGYSPINLIPDTKDRPIIEFGNIREEYSERTKNNANNTPNEIPAFLVRTEISIPTDV